MVQTRSRQASATSPKLFTPKRAAISRHSALAASTSSASSPAARKNGSTLKKNARKRNSGPPPRADVKPLHRREREFSTISDWIEKAMLDGSPLSIYISGSPGTGKTATIRLVLQQYERQIVSTILNCASVHSQTELIRSILGTIGSTERATVAGLSSALEGLRKHFVLVLDEIDHLTTRTNSFLYSAFQWPQSVTSKLIVIGIANSIDLTERLLPKLKLNHPPETLVFAPYSKDAIAEILKIKMSDDSDTGMDSKAVELCSRKVAAMSGDLRTALHVIKQTRNLNEPSTPRGCREVLGVLNGVYSSPLARARLPLQPRLMLATALAVSSNKKNALTVNSLTNAYARACDVVKVPRLEGDDFAAAMQILESQSFIAECAGGKLVLKVDAATAKSAIADSVMIAQVSRLNL